MITFDIVDEKNENKGEPVQLNDADGLKLLRLLGIPAIQYMKFDIEQLPAFRETVVDQIPYDSTVDRIAGNLRYGNEAMQIAQYLLKNLKALSTMLQYAIKNNKEVEMKRVD